MFFGTEVVFYVNTHNSGAFMETQPGVVTQLTDACKAPLTNKLSSASPRQVGLLYLGLGFLLARVI